MACFIVTKTNLYLLRKVVRTCVFMYLGTPLPADITLVPITVSSSFPTLQIAVCILLFR